MKETRCTAVFYPLYGRTGVSVNSGEVYRFIPDGAAENSLHFCGKEELYFPDDPEGYNQLCFRKSKGY